MVTFKKLALVALSIFLVPVSLDAAVVMDEKMTVQVLSMDSFVLGIANSEGSNKRVISVAKAAHEFLFTILLEEIIEEKYFDSEVVCEVIIENLQKAEQTEYNYIMVKQLALMIARDLSEIARPSKIAEISLARIGKNVGIKIKNCLTDIKRGVVNNFKVACDASGMAFDVSSRLVAISMLILMQTSLCLSEDTNDLNSVKLLCGFALFGELYRVFSLPLGLTACCN